MLEAGLEAGWHAGWLLDDKEALLVDNCQSVLEAVPRELGDDGGWGCG